MVKKAKEIVRLRFRTLKNGEKSAYFDIYENGVRQYLWQEERLLPESDDASREHNSNVLQVLEERRRSLIAELTIDKSGIANRSFNTEITLLQWIEVYRKELSTRACHSYMCGLSKLKDYLSGFNEGILLKDVNEETAVSFYEYLKAHKCTNNEDHTLGEGSIWYLLKILGNCLNGAIRARYIDTNPCRGMLSVCRKRQKKRGLECLSKNELIKLIDTPYRMEFIKRMFLFACFTGATPETLRLLRWKHIYKKDGRTWAILKQTRSGKDIAVPLTEIAIACLPPRRRAKGSCYVFEFRTEMVMRYHLNNWRTEAGITTSLRFITARNTYASLLLNADADFYTAGYMMGFSSTKYMEEYEGYLNGKNYDAVAKMDDILDCLTDIESIVDKVKNG